MKNRIQFTSWGMFIVAVVLLVTASASAQESTVKYSSFAEFESAVQAAVLTYGQPTKESTPLAGLPSSEGQLAGWMNWGHVFVSDEPSKCPTSVVVYDYSYSKTTLDRKDPDRDATVDVCYAIDAAKRVRSRSEAPSCDQNNANHHFCFDVY